MMTRFTFDPARTPAPVRAALQLIGEDFPIAPATRGRANVELRLAGPGPRVETAGGRAVVSGPTLPQLLRALASLRAAGSPAPLKESPRFDTLGFMLDCSRNAVPRVETVRFFLRRAALMGLNLVMLYTEDTYEVPGEPYFGHLRGRFTRAELRGLDDYAAALGVEMAPCIQTLAHLSQPLRWWTAYAGVKGSPDFLYVGQEKTYELIDRLIGAAGGAYRSRRIHLGMDEAHGLGQGRCKAVPGERTEFDIFTEHLRRVVAIARRHGLRPMIWSDMFFTIASGGYYSEGGDIPKAVAKRVPPEVQLVYWDYYHQDPAFYGRMIDRHRAMGKEPVFAPGLWTDHVFWAHYSHARIDTDAGMLACKRRGVREAFTTAWGDDGAMPA
jgi:hypothetical protein